MNLDRLSSRVKEVNLFSALGVELSEPPIIRIRSWDDWPGPKDSRVETIHTHMQSLHDAIVFRDTEPQWNRALRLTVDIARYLVPFDESQDAWYGPNIAVWSAAWVFALEEVHTAKSIPLPSEMRAQLYWYERGHWPCALVSLSRRENIEDYVVY
jgi:hypothetical protein